MEKEIGEELYGFIIEINKWFDYYCRNHANHEIDKEIFYELEKIFSEYAQFKFEEKERGEKAQTR